MHSKERTCVRNVYTASSAFTSRRNIIQVSTLLASGTVNDSKRLKIVEKTMYEIYGIETRHERLSEWAKSRNTIER